MTSLKATIVPEFKFNVSDNAMIKIERLLLINNINISEYIEIRNRENKLDVKLVTNNPDKTAEILDVLEIKYNQRRVIQVELAPRPGQLLLLQQCLNAAGVKFKSLNSAELTAIVRVESKQLECVLDIIRAC